MILENLSNKVNPKKKNIYLSSWKLEADKIARPKLGAWGWGRKDRYRSREEDTLIKRGIVGLARGLTLEGVPDVHRDVSS